MEVCTTIAELQQRINVLKKHMDDSASSPSVGLVPTMGYLHEGHAALISRARAENEIVVVSAFVNPLQFGPQEDLDRYPRDGARDADLCVAHRVDLLFVPSVAEMYGETGCLTTITVATLGDHLCGATRPGHFDGVCTVVGKLFQIVHPDRAYFGKKDAQQWRIIRRMVQDLSMPVTIVACPIVREADGLAKSSRNVFLSAEEREQAVALNRTLVMIEKLFAQGERNAAVLEHEGRRLLTQYNQITIDYIMIVDGDQLQPCAVIAQGQSVLCAIAAYVGHTRLIDNTELS